MSSAAFGIKPPLDVLRGPVGIGLRNILITLMLTVATMATVGYVWKEAGYEMLIVTMGWPHVLLGFLFYFGRVLRGEADARGGLVLLATLTCVLWLLHYNYSLTGLIYLYFLFHAFRDEIFVFLQTQARHKAATNVFAIGGIAPLILLILLIPQQQNFRQDLRRVEFAAETISVSGWTLIPFRPIHNSRERDFYFYLQSPRTEGVRGFISYASTVDSRPAGEVLVNDRSWSEAADLVFQPYYENKATLQSSRDLTGTLPVLLTGGHRVGQTFTAEAKNLAGIWVPINPLEPSTKETSFVFHLASPPLLPYSERLADLRLVLIVMLSGIVLWRLFPHAGNTSHLWIYLLVLGGAFAGTQMTLKSASNAGYPFPLIFQFVVVYHYWSWYVFSFDKLKAKAGQA